MAEFAPSGASANGHQASMVLIGKGRGQKTEVSRCEMDALLHTELRDVYPHGHSNEYIEWHFAQHQDNAPVSAQAKTSPGQAQNVEPSQGFVNPYDLPTGFSFDAKAFPKLGDKRKPKKHN